MAAWSKTAPKLCRTTGCAACSKSIAGIACSRTRRPSPRSCDVAKGNKPKPFMPWFIMDFERDTGHLSFEECECYRRLIESLWKRDVKPLPNDDVVLARLIRAELQAWLRYRPLMEPFFQITTEGWQHNRVVEIYLWCIAKMQAEREKGKKGAEPPVGNAQADAQAMPEQYNSKSKSKSESKTKPQSSENTSKE